MKPRPSLDNRLLALITVAFSLLSAGTLCTELVHAADAHVVAARA